MHARIVHPPQPQPHVVIGSPDGRRQTIPVEAARMLLDDLMRIFDVDTIDAKTQAVVDAAKRLRKARSVPEGDEGSAAWREHLSARMALDAAVDELNRGL